MSLLSGLHLAAAAVVTPSAPSTGIGPNINSDGDPTSGPVAPGLIAFLIVVILGLVLWFLLKNMGKQMSRAKEHFDAEELREAALAGVGSSTSVPAPAEGDAQ